MRIASLLAGWSLLWLSLPFEVEAAPLAPAVEEVRNLLRDGKVDDAVDAGEEATEQLQQDAMAWLWAGRAYGRQAMEANVLMKPKWAGRTRDAFEKAVALDPKLIDARFDLMQYYLMAPSMLGGGRDKADAQVAAIGDLDASMGDLARGLVAQMDKQSQLAEQAFRRALASNPDNARARMSLSNLLQSEQRMAETHALWNERHAAKPDDWMATYQLGRHAAITGEHLEEGLAHLDAFLTADALPEGLSIAGAHWRRGQILEKLGRSELALEAYRHAIQDDSVGELAKADLERLSEKSRG